MKLLIIAVSCLVYGGIFGENWFILECDLVCADFAIGLRGGIRRITQTTRKERSSCIKNCSKHTPCCLTVSIISHICQQSYLLLLGIPSPTHFHSRLKTSLFCKSFQPQPFLSLLQDSLHGFLRLFTVISEYICFLLLVFLFLHFLVVGSVR